ncbi:substrate-binding domain-containing protein [Streptomyces sp. NBC_00059]|uniref:substrate-binding domain-containing protein n=1 Tax=Streptomyces sp. NBC_00059 TaxID=2975635 RepID=UPI00225009DE|nr:substrate-binding domain-containing protein [Streptomyces sp. NBC_00059]MCX5410511.1 substrate-binding domain-containing protein [Streptomyces sp. NBC_00059]
MNVRTSVRIGAAAGAAALGLGIMAPVASADPSGYRVLAGVGSDTTQDVGNALGDAVDGGTLIASYDATGSATIQTRSTGCVIPRPNGSSNGITALNNSVDNATGCIDFARSSRGPAAAGTDLTFIPFAEDQVTVAVRSDSALNNNLDLTTTQLKDIYECNLTTLNGVALTPLLPQAGSGTRSFFLAEIGNPAVGTCVGTMQEHNGVELDSAGDLAPYSVAQYNAQVGGAVDDRHGATVLGTIGGGVISRDVYNVVPTAKLTDSVIDATFVGADSKVCAESGVIEDFGFTAIDHCGSTDLQGER